MIPAGNSLEFRFPAQVKTATHWERYRFDDEQDCWKPAIASRQPRGVVSEHFAHHQWRRTRLADQTNPIARIKNTKRPSASAVFLPGREIESSITGGSSKICATSRVRNKPHHESIMQT